MRIANGIIKTMNVYKKREKGAHNGIGVVVGSTPRVCENV